MHKIYFTASLRGIQYYLHNYQEIYRCLEELGCEHLDKEILTLNKSKYYSSLERKGSKEFHKLYEKKIKAIQEASMCVFEVSIQSLSIGFQVQRALDYHKPTVLLYLPENTPHFLKGMENDKIIAAEYTSENLSEVVKKAYEEALSKRDQRFNFFISTELLTHLEDASAKKGITKSNYLRSLIEKDMITGKSKKK